MKNLFYAGILLLSWIMPAAAQPAGSALLSYNMSAKTDDKYIYYKVKQGDNLTAIAQKYGTTLQVLQMLNTGININNILIGQTLVIPAKSISPVAPVSGNTNTAPVKTAVTLGAANAGNAIFHKVAAGETLYAICQKYGVSAVNVKTWNNLQNINNILVGTNLIVGYNGPAPDNGSTPAVSAGVNTVPVTASAPARTTATSGAPAGNVMGSAVKTDSSPAPVVQKADSPDDLSNVSESSSTAPAGNLVSLTEKGIATWTRNGSDDGNYYALHRTAAPGTMITVRNLNNGNTVQVKVIGRLPDVASNKNILIKISGSAAQKLGILDDKALVELQYMGLKEEGNSSQK